MGVDMTWADMKQETSFVCDMCRRKPARSCGSCGKKLCREHADGEHHGENCTYRYDDDDD